MRIGRVICYLFLVACIIFTGTSKTGTVYALSSENSGFAGGSGTPDDPYLIETAEQLDAVRNGLTSSYKLIQDIDLAEFLADKTEGWEPIGFVTLEQVGSPDLFLEITTSFRGEFDGNGHVISGLWIDAISVDRDIDPSYGLFGYITDCKIKNLGIELAEQGIRVSMENMQVDASVGGIAGRMCPVAQESKSEIINCYVSGRIYANCRNDNVGGLVGWASAWGTKNNTIVISGCFFEGQIEGGLISGALVGSCHCGPMGYGKFLIENCYSLGDISSKAIAGGIFGIFSNDRSDVIVRNSYSTMMVSADQYRDSIGNYLPWEPKDNPSTLVLNCYYLKQNGISSSSPATPLSAEEMLHMSNFKGFDPAIWSCDDGTGMPYLKNNKYPEHATTARNGDIIHIVKAGDTLWDIAGKTYGDPWEWVRIYEANKDSVTMIGDTIAIIEIGQQLTIPG